MERAEGTILVKMASNESFRTPKPVSHSSTVDRMPPSAIGSRSIAILHHTSIQYL